MRDTPDTVGRTRPSSVSSGDWVVFMPELAQGKTGARMKLKTDAFVVELVA